MKKLFLIALCAIVGLGAATAQTIEELKASKAGKEEMLAAKQAELDALAGEIASLVDQINKLSGWRFGGVGILGFDLNGNSDWTLLDNPDSRASGWGFNFIGFANRDTEKSFWNNTLTLNLRRTNTQADADADAVKATTDQIDLASLYGYKLSDKWAITAEGKYTTTLLNFNNPGKLLLSAGLTWTPISNLVVNIHPLGYEINFPGELSSVAGAKIGATYANSELIPGVAWTSVFNAFLAYGGDDVTFDNGQTFNYTGGDLTNWTWVNGFSFTVFKGLGVGFNVGLANNRQQTDLWRSKNANLSSGGNLIIEDENPLQLYYTLGLAYTL